MPSAYILDTNVLMGDPEAMHAFEGKTVILPIRVLRELDKHKTRQDRVGANTRRAVRNIEQLRLEGSIGKGVPLPNGGTFLVDIEDTEEKADDSILAVAKKHGGKLITNDIHLRCLASCYEVPTDPYERDAKDVTEIYGGASTVYVSPEQIDQFYKEGGLDFDVEQFEEPLCPNQMVVLKSEGKQSALSRWFRGRCFPFRGKGDAVINGIISRNTEQAFAMDLLMDPEVPLVTLLGKAGCGKSLLALAAGLQQSQETDLYRKLIVSRPVQPLGNDIGYLPGDLSEKMAPWIAPIKDSINVVLKDADPDTVEMMFETGVVEIEALTYIRGRSLPRAYIIIDEAQNMSVDEMKAVVTRVGEGSKIVITGDIEQVDSHRFDSKTNGLAYLVEKMRDQDLAGHITLLKGERSELATLAAAIL